MFLRNFRYLCIYPWWLREVDACWRHVDDHVLVLFCVKCVWNSVSVVIQFSQMFLLICLRVFSFYIDMCLVSSPCIYCFYVVHHFAVSLILVWITMKHCLLFFDPTKGYEMFISIVFYKILVVWVNMNKLMH